VAGDVHLFQPAHTVRLHYPNEVERRLPVGDNPPAGAVIDYYLKTKPSEGDVLTLEILTADGKLIRRVTNRPPADGALQPAEWTDREKPADIIPDSAGANRFVWDLRGEDPEKIPGAFYADDGPRGPLVAPGHYQVRLSIHGLSETAPLEVVPDPRLDGQMTDSEINELSDLSRRTWADIDALHKAVNQIRESRARLETIKKWSKDNPAAKPVVDAASEFAAKMAPIEARLVQVKMAASEDNLRYPNMLNEQYDTFSATLDSEDFGPTESQRQVYAYLHGELTGELGKWRALRDTEMPALQSLMRAQGVPSIGESREP
jgi:hypothetical protein